MSNGCLVQSLASQTQVRNDSASPIAPSPRVSVGMPVYNGAAHIRDAIDTILAQTFADFELIISDNCSDDGTAQICHEYERLDGRIIYLRQSTNLGASQNFRCVFESARGTYFKWAAHDDMIAPTYLERCVDTLDNSGPEVVLCFPKRLWMRHNGHILGPDGIPGWPETRPPYDRISFARLMRLTPIAHPVIAFGLMRREAAARTRLIGPYCHSDLVFVEEMRLLGEFREISEYLFFTRRHDDKFTRWHSAMRGNITPSNLRAVEAAWYDPANIGKAVEPEKRLLVERIRSVRRLGPVGFARLPCYAAIAVGHLVRHTPRIVKQPLYAVRPRIWGTWERFSAKCVNRSISHFLPHRLWAFLSGVRNLDRRKLALAFAKSSTATHESLLEFTARKLSLRQDAPARDVLLSWLSGSCPMRQSAAENALMSLPNMDARTVILKRRVDLENLGQSSADCVPSKILSGGAFLRKGV